MADSQNANRIGELNGPWSILLRVALATYPLILAWTVWITNETFYNRAFRDRGDRFTKTDGLVMEARIMEIIAKLPPADWRTKVDKIVDNQTEMMRSIDKLQVHTDIHDDVPKTK